MNPQALLKGMSPMPGEGSPWARMRESFEDIVKGAGLVIGGEQAGAGGAEHRLSGGAVSSEDGAVRTRSVSPASSEDGLPRPKFTLGVNVQEHDGVVTIVSLADNSPCSKFLRTGDMLHSIDGRPIRTVGALRGASTGEPGTLMSVRFRRPGWPAPRTFVLARSVTKDGRGTLTHYKQHNTGDPGGSPAPAPPPPAPTPAAPHRASGGGAGEREQLHDGEGSWIVGGDSVGRARLEGFWARQEERQRSRSPALAPPPESPPLSADGQDSHRLRVVSPPTQSTPDKHLQQERTPSPAIAGGAGAFEAGRLQGFAQGLRERMQEGQALRAEDASALLAAVGAVEAVLQEAAAHAARLAREKAALEARLRALDALAAMPDPATGEASSLAAVARQNELLQQEVAALSATRLDSHVPVLLFHEACRERDSLRRQNAALAAKLRVRARAPGVGRAREGPSPDEMGLPRP